MHTSTILLIASFLLCILTAWFWFDLLLHQELWSMPVAAFLAGACESTYSSARSHASMEFFGRK